MFRFTVRAPLTQVADLAADNLCDCELDEGDEDGTTYVRMDDYTASVFVRILNKLGFVWHTGRPRGAHSDPTFARAAQHLAQLTHVRHGEISHDQLDDIRYDEEQ